MRSRPEHHTPPLPGEPTDTETARMPSATAPAVAPPRWSGRKPAVSATLAVGLRRRSRGGRDDGDLIGTPSAT